MNLLPVFIAGLAGSVHCAGMCGGIVSAFSVGAPPRAAARVIPIARAGQAAHVLSYNTGRIASYMLAGAIAGGLAGSVASLAPMASLQMAGYWMANLMLAAIGLYLMDAWRGLARIEAAGGVLWRGVQPLIKPLVPMDTPWKALALGGLWGWVPCGMVYSVLLTAMLTGSALDGTLVMGAFGLGTLPMLLAMGMAGAELRQYLQQRRVRLACGLLVLAFAVLGLVRAASGQQHTWLDLLCLTVRP